MVKAVEPEVLNLGCFYAVFRGGEITGEPPTGIYFGDTRVVGGLHYTLGGVRLKPVGAARSGFTITYTYDVGFTRIVGAARCGLVERVVGAPSGLRLVLRPDFSDIFEVRGVIVRGRLGVPKPQPSVVVRRGGVAEVLYRGVGGFSAGFRVSSSGRLLIRGGLLEVEAQGSELALRIAGRGRLRPPTRPYTRFLADTPHLESDNPTLRALYHSCVRDLFSLLEDPPQSCFPLAGVPDFNTVFGRDSIITSFQTLLFNPRIGADTLARLGRLVGVRVDPQTEEEPGKIIHELRRGELSSRYTPFRSYYGSVDSTPLYVALYHEYRAVHPDVEIDPAASRAAAMGAGWLASRLRSQGLLGYVPGVLRNQGWKDSGGSVFHTDGSDPKPPIFLVEVQGYAEWALRVAGRATGDGELSKLAAGLRGRIASDFWCARTGYFGEALDGGGRLAEIVTSNPGHLLWSGSVDRGFASKIAATLADRGRLNSGYGVKTLGFGEPRHDPESYHNGSVWPHENSLILKGLSDYGFEEEFLDILEGYLAAYTTLGLGGFPEHYSGVRPPEKPRALGCYPQAWAAGSAFMVVQALLGLRVGVDGEGHYVVIQPRLPRSVGRIKVGDLYVFGGRLRVEVERKGVEPRVRAHFTVEPKVGCRMVC